MNSVTFLRMKDRRFEVHITNKKCLASLMVEVLKKISGERFVYSIQSLQLFKILKEHNSILTQIILTKTSSAKTKKVKLTRVP